MDKLALFTPGCHYHVFNRTNNREDLFLSNENRRYFLQQFDIYLQGFVDTFSYSLLTNHFHFSVRVKSIEQLNDHLSSIKNWKRSKKQIKFIDSSDKHDACHYLIAPQFSRLFASYCQAFNKMNNRHGNLFNRPFKRIRIENVGHLAYLQYYIHHNARKHGLVKDFLGHKWHSYETLISNNPTFLDRKSIFDFYGGRDLFIQFHQDQHSAERFEKLIIEE